MWIQYYVDVIPICGLFTCLSVCHLFKQNQRIRAHLIWAVGKKLRLDEVRDHDGIAE